MNRDSLRVTAITIAAIGFLAACDNDFAGSTAAAKDPATPSNSAEAASTVETAAAAAATHVAEAANPATSAIPNDTINAMGAQCTAKIGVIEPFSCLDGEIIPIQVNGVAKSGNDPLPETCDNPSWLGGNYKSFCQPNARLGRLPNLDAYGQPEDDVHNIFIFRRYNYESSPENPCFEVVVIIHHQKSTGDT